MNKEKNLSDDAMISEALIMFIKAIFLAIFSILLLVGVLEFLGYDPGPSKITIIRSEYREFEVLEYDKHKVSLLDVKTHQLFQERFGGKFSCRMLPNIKERSFVKVEIEYYTVSNEPNKTFIRIADVRKVFCQ